MIAGHEFLEDRTDGGRKCAYRNYTLLKEYVGASNMYLCMFSKEKNHKNTTHIKVFSSHKNHIMQMIGAIRNNVICSRNVEKQVIDYALRTDIDTIFCERSITGLLVEKIVKKYSSTGKKIKVILFQQNIEKNYVWNKVRHESLAYMVPFFAFCKNEKVAVRIADKLITLTERDNVLSKKIYGRTADFVLPMTFDDALKDFGETGIETTKEVLRSSKNKLLFVGRLFRPNYEGLAWFLKEVMPKLDQLDLFIVGKGLESKKNVLEKANVHVIGAVDDLTPYYLEADAMILPIFYGDGMKVKTAEAIMYGKTIFATDEALEGYEVENTQYIYCCNSAESFLHSIEAHFSNPQNLEMKIKENVRELFMNKYNSKTVSKEFYAFLDSI